MLWFTINWLISAENEQWIKIINPKHLTQSSSMNNKQWTFKYKKRFKARIIGYYIILPWTLLWSIPYIVYLFIPSNVLAFISYIAYINITFIVLCVIYCNIPVFEDKLWIKQELKYLLLCFAVIVLIVIPYALLVVGIGIDVEWITDPIVDWAELAILFIGYSSGLVLFLF